METIKLKKERNIYRKSPKSGSKPDSIIFFLHGYGADGADLFSLSEYFSLEMPNTQFVSPDAPFTCKMSPSGREWFPIDKIPTGAIDASKDFLVFLEREMNFYSVTFENIFLIGFSQGAMMSLQTMLISNNKIGGVIAYSGGISIENINSAKSMLKNEKHQFISTPILLIHGELDNIVPFSSLENSLTLLRNIGFNPYTLSRPNLGHSIDDEGLLAAKQFLKTHASL